jgi:hypothetical protein
MHDFIGFTGGDETRPRNVALLPCIKAFGAVSVAGMADLAELLTGIATQAEAEAGADNTKLMTPQRVRQSIGANVPLGAVSSWVNFNGQGVVAIREQLNVASITDMGAGFYRVNFATPMANTNYAIFGLHGNVSTAGDERNNLYIDEKETTHVQFYTTNVHGQAGDWDNVSIATMGGVS